MRGSDTSRGIVRPDACAVLLLVLVAVGRPARAESAADSPASSPDEGPDITAAFHLTPEDGDRMDEFTRAQWQERVRLGLEEFLRAKSEGESGSAPVPPSLAYDRAAGKVTLRGTREEIDAARDYLRRVPGLITDYGMRRDFALEHAPPELVAAEVRRILRLEPAEERPPVARERIRLRIGEERLWHGLRIRLTGVETNSIGDPADDAARLAIAADGTELESLVPEGRDHEHGRYRVAVGRVVRPIGWNATSGASADLRLFKLADAAHNDPSAPDYLAVSVPPGSSSVRVEYNSRWRLDEAEAVIAELDRPNLRYRIVPRLVELDDAAAETAGRLGLADPRWVLVRARLDALGSREVRPFAPGLLSEEEGFVMKLTATTPGRGAAAERPVFLSLEIGKVLAGENGEAWFERVVWTARGDETELTIREERLRVPPDSPLILPTGEAPGRFVVFEVRDLRPR